MPTFDSLEELERHVVDRMKYAVIDVADKATDAFMEKADTFYGEYSPKQYVRTGTFKDSIRILDVIGEGNGWSADVGFDDSIPSHPDAGISEAEIMSLNAVSGTHGGRAPGTAVYTAGVSDIGGQITTWSKSALHANGLPVE